MRTLDFYEFVGVFAPGVTFLVGLALIIGDDASSWVQTSSTLGGAAFLLVVAYVLGHLLQAVGNLAETTWWWVRRGVPTDWARTGRGSLLRPGQRKRLAVLALERDPSNEALETVDTEEWSGITREMIVRVKNAHRDERLGRFNGNYGLFRGVLAGALVLMIASFGYTGSWIWQEQIALLVIGALALLRMDRFGQHYARELFLQVLDLSAEPD